MSLDSTTSDSVGQSDTAPDQFKFTCSSPDFTIRTLPDGTIFRVSRAKMIAGSQVFGDMFEVASAGPVKTRGLDEDPETEEEHTMDVYERSDVFASFLVLIHDGLGHSTTEKSTQMDTPVESGAQTQSTGLQANNAPQSIVTPAMPIQTLEPLLQLLDKYDVPAVYQDVLHAHFRINAVQNPLAIYSLAHQLDLTNIASFASQYLLSRPPETYTLEELDEYFPSAKAYHRLVLLHEYRKKRLRDVLRAEEIFPHGYGYCPQHGQQTTAQWERLQLDVAHRLAAGTDVVAEMAIMKGSVQSCYKCHQACKMAVDMLQYKVDKIEKTFDCIPGAMHVVPPR